LPLAYSRMNVNDLGPVATPSDRTIRLSLATCRATHRVRLFPASQPSLLEASAALQLNRRSFRRGRRRRPLLSIVDWHNNDDARHKKALTATGAETRYVPMTTAESSLRSTIFNAVRISTSDAVSTVSSIVPSCRRTPNNGYEIDTFVACRRSLHNDLGLLQELLDLAQSPSHASNARYEWRPSSWGPWISKNKWKCSNSFVGNVEPVMHHR